MKFPDLDLVLIESGGDNLAATFSPELADLTIYVIDVAAGDKIPSQGRPRHHPLGPPGHQQDRPRALCRRLAGDDGARIANGCAARGRSIFTNLRAGEGVEEIARFIEEKGGLSET